jgi:hypothetical protein
MNFSRDNSKARGKRGGSSVAGHSATDGIVAVNQAVKKR